MPGNRCFLSAAALAALLHALVWLGVAQPVRLSATPGRGTPLDLARGPVHGVSTVAELKAALAAANFAKVPVTLLLSNGTYVLDETLEVHCPGLVLRSAQGDRDTVIVRGPDEGPNATVGDVFLVSGNDVVIADLTLGYCRFHGIQVRGESPFEVAGLRVHNCRLVNCNQQFIKGSSSENDPLGATDGCIEQCLFEFTRGWAYQSYTGGIDIHKGVGWTVRDNLFRNLRTTADQGLAEHAIHFWKRCPARPQNIVIERNWIVNCDRGIGFGLGNLDGGFQGGASVIRDNLVFNDGAGPHTDVGIGLEYASGVLVESNTVVVQRYWAPIEYRFSGSSNLVFRGNLVNGPIQQRDGAPPAAQAGNVELNLVSGPVNGALLERNGKSLAVYGDPTGERSTPEIVLLAEARRDVAWAARKWAEHGAQIVAPAQEIESLVHPERFWVELRQKRFHDYSEQTTKVPVQPLPVSRGVKAGDTVHWENLSFRVLATPGYTRGAVSFLLELGGQKIAFTGDLIRDDGKLEDLFSLQDAIPEAKIGGYHGWAGRLGQLMASLDRLAAEAPALLIPLRGPPIPEPAAALQRLRERIRAAYANYLSIDALRWYFKDEHILAKARRVLGPDAHVDGMEMAETLPLPTSIVAIANSRLILADDGSGFLVDCGGQGIIDELRKLRAAGKLKSLDHVFVTHYHDDHTDALPELVKEFGAQIHACGSLVDLLEHPGDYRLPCLTANPAVVTARQIPGDTGRWKEYRLRIFDFPGQTLYHNALLMQRDGGWSAFFAGDSFTPSGIDDYCLQNRNFLHEGTGYLRCLDQLAQLPRGCLILNQHVEPAFRFSPAQMARMRETLRQRIPLLAQLLPYDDPNFGLDESWAVLHPYWQAARPGTMLRLELRITNHSPRARMFRTTLHTPDGFRVDGGGAVQLAAHADGAILLAVQIPTDARPGLQVLTADIASDDIDLREWTETVLEVGE